MTKYQVKTLQNLGIYFRFLKMKLKKKQIMANAMLMSVNTEPYTIIQVIMILITLIGVPSGGMPSRKS